jgi:hypothetical protein
LDEAEKVISDRRRSAKQAARLIFQDFDGSVDESQINQIIDFVMKELDNERDSVVDHVIQHIKGNKGYYTGLTQTDSRMVLDGAASDIDSDFNQAIDIVNSIRKQNSPEFNCTIFPKYLPDHSLYSIFPEVDRTLSESPNDRDILMDSYHLTQENEIEDIYFVTKDGSDILSNESLLEDLLPPIDIEPPETLI